jgi:hypothetical protein
MKENLAVPLYNMVITCDSEVEWFVFVLVTLSTIHV